MLGEDSSLFTHCTPSGESISIHSITFYIFKAFLFEAFHMQQCKRRTWSLLYPKSICIIFLFLCPDWTNKEACKQKSYFPFLLFSFPSYFSLCLQFHAKPENHIWRDCSSEYKILERVSIFSSNSSQKINPLLKTVTQSWTRSHPFPSSWKNRSTSKSCQLRQTVEKNKCCMSNMCRCISLIWNWLVLKTSAPHSCCCKKKTYYE